jgi:hypothetical protein
MPDKLNFYDLKSKKRFSSNNYKIVVKKGRRFAVTKAPSGIESWRILGAAKK